jgi:alpha-1,6-mannosyltransferase
VRLLDVTEFYSPWGGGVRTYLTEKARWVARQSDFEHAIVLPGDRDRVEVWQRSRVYFVRGPAVPASPGYHFLIARNKLAEIVRLERPDVIEVGSPYTAPWLARRAARRARSASPIQLVAFVHENPRLYAARSPRAIRGVLDRFLARYLSAAHRDFALAAAASSTNLDGFGVARTAVVPLGVDTVLFRPAWRDAAWREETGAWPGQPVALYAGRLSAEKGLDVVLEALPQVHAGIGLRLVVIGEGHLRPRLERLARERPGMLRVLPFEGDRGRLARAYASADLFFAPCPFETFGLAALEAMASGLPVVGVAAGGIGRLLFGADWGRTYRVGDPGDCARGMLELAALDLRALGARARAAAVASYGWDRTFTELVGLYRRLVSEAPSAARAVSSPPSPAPGIPV